MTFPHWWGGPPGPRGSPWTRISSLDQHSSRPARASAADPGADPWADPWVRQTMVLGLGNLVHTDDGLGVHAIHHLQRDPRVAPGVMLLDGGTQGLSLAAHISGFQKLLVIDAIDAGAAPGTLVRYDGKALEGLPGKPSVHQLGFADLMVAMKLLEESPQEVVVMGVQPLSMEWSAELTQPVREALPGLIDAVIEQLDMWKASSQIGE